MSAVLDASACLAYLQREAGADVVAEVLTHGAYISAVNLAEVLSKLAEWGRDPEQAYIEMMNRGLVGPAAGDCVLSRRGCSSGYSISTSRSVPE
ncbi:MAG: PIN domain-containing protein [Gammaproteobacteria bacterium]